MGFFDHKVHIFEPGVFDLPIMYDCQRSLDKAQAMPVVGFIFVSPIKAIVSAVEFVIGFALTIIGALGTLLHLCFTGKFSDSLSHFTWTAMKEAGLGLLGIAYSVCNILTLGILGYRIEGNPCGSDPALRRV